MLRSVGEVSKRALRCGGDVERGVRQGVWEVQEEVRGEVWGSEGGEGRLGEGVGRGEKERVG